MRTSTQKKRTRILDIATELFIKQGYKNTSLDQIVAICGGSKQTLYRYFSNKEGLFIEVLAHNTKGSMESIFQLTEKQDQPLQDILEHFAFKYLKNVCVNPILGVFRIVSADFNKHDSIPQQFWLDGVERIHQYLIEFLNTNKEACSSLQIEDAKLACDQLLSLIKLDYLSLALVGIDLPDDEKLRQDVKKAVNAFLTLYRKG